MLFPVDLVQRRELYHTDFLEQIGPLIARNLTELEDVPHDSVIEPGRPARAVSPLSSHSVEHIDRQAVASPEFRCRDTEILRENPEVLEIGLLPVERPARGLQFPVLACVNPTR
jgi:hypothetical protein